MKKVLCFIAAAVFVFAAVFSTTSCKKENDNDYYKFINPSHENGFCDFRAAYDLFNSTYKDKTWMSKETSKDKAKAIWKDAEAAFKAVEDQLIADTSQGCYVEVSMLRYSEQNKIMEPVETIGSWRFPAK